MLCANLGNGDDERAGTEREPEGHRTGGSDDHICPAGSSLTTESETRGDIKRTGRSSNRPSNRSQGRSSSRQPSENWRKAAGRPANRNKSHTKRTGPNEVYCSALRTRSRNETGTEEVAKVGNWQPGGGRRRHLRSFNRRCCRARVGWVDGYARHSPCTYTTAAVAGDCETLHTVTHSTELSS
jgi:hypothetical protein